MCDVTWMLDTGACSRERRACSGDRALLCSEVEHWQVIETLIKPCILEDDSSLILHGNMEGVLLIR